MHLHTSATEIKNILGYEAPYGFSNMNSSGDGYSFLRGSEDDQEEEISIKEEEVGNPRSFALFDSPSASKFRFSTKTSQFYDKHVSSELMVQNSINQQGPMALV